jgi:hypothetical protein
MTAGVLRLVGRLPRPEVRGLHHQLQAGQLPHPRPGVNVKKLFTIVI